MRRENLYFWVTPGALLLAATLLAGNVQAGESVRCYTAEIDQAVVLPDGSVHAPGRLQLCNSLQLNPVAALHETAVNGQPIGLYRSSIDRGEGTVEEDRAVFVFIRDGPDRLELQGYAVSQGEQMRVFDMRRGKPVIESLATAVGRLLEREYRASRPFGEERLVLAASR
jgi:hypothetical protein